MTPRSDKPAQAKVTEQTTGPLPVTGEPLIQQGVQGHNFGTQFAFEVNNKIGKLETGLAGVEKRLEKVENKLDQVQVDIACLKTTTGHIETIMQSSVKALWGIFIVVLAAFATGIVTLAVYWIKAKGGL